MKGASLKNPFANLVAMNYKTIETRVGNSSLAKTKHRGEILICTSKGIHDFWKDCQNFYMFDDPKDRFDSMDPYFKKACDKVWKEAGENWLEFKNLMMYPMNK